ncbi:hypothetical protein HN011_010952 [Eciton burchellii]|nr:hypothetical protein HN011_010952 [Eciton burchellii]
MLQNRNTCVNEDKVAELVPAYDPLTNGQSTNTCQWHRSNPDAALAKAHQGPISSERWSDEHMTSGMLCSKSPGRKDCVDFAGELVPELFGISQYSSWRRKNKYSNYITIDTKLSTSECIIFAATSKLFAATLTYSYRLQDHHHNYHGTWDCIQRTWRSEEARIYYHSLLRM